MLILILFFVNNDFFKLNNIPKFEFCKFIHSDF